MGKEPQPSLAEDSGLSVALKRKQTNSNRWVFLLALWVPLGFMLTLAFLAHQGQKFHDEDSRLLLHTVEVKGQVEHLYSLVKDVETSQRGYLLTGDSSFLALYEKALKEIPGQSQSLDLLVADNPRQVANAAQLKTLIAERLSVAAQSVSLAQQGKAFDAIQMVKDGDGKQLMEQIELKVDAMTAEEERLLTVRKDVFISQVKNQTSLMGGLVLGDIALIVGVTLFMSHLQKSRQKAEARTDQADVRTEEANARTEAAESRGGQAMLASELRYRRLFETAPDGILILDADDGQVVDANPFMKDLLGYSQKEFLGRKLWEIGPFRGAAASKIAFAELQRNV
jgi:CHASE3 domain sensor protein